MRSSHNNHDNLIAALDLVNPNNVIPDLEQSVEVAKLTAKLNPCETNEERLRDLSFLLNFFRLRRLGG